MGLSEVTIRELGLSQLCYGAADCFIDTPAPCDSFFREDDVDKSADTPCGIADAHVRSDGSNLSF